MSHRANYGIDVNCIRSVDCSVWNGIITYLQNLSRCIIKYGTIRKRIGLDVRKYEHNNSLILLDFTMVADNPYLGIPTAFGLKGFINKIQAYHKNKKLVVIEDMSLYNHFKNINDLLNFESLPHEAYGDQNWK